MFVDQRDRPAAVLIWSDACDLAGRASLAELGITHVTCAPYYPQGNGKAEAFIRTLKR